MDHSSGLSSAHVVSLGCAKNSIDSERLEALLEQSGLEIVPDPHRADVLVVNTCSFIDPAKAESIEVIMDAVRLKAAGKCRRLIVAGCMVESDLGELQEELPEVDGFIGLDDFGSLPGLLGLGGEAGPGGPCVIGSNPDGRLALPRMRRLRPWAYLQVSDGCNHACSYCAIPGIRGPLRSRPLDSIMAEAAELAATGVKEVSLVAQDITQYGRDLGEDLRLEDVAGALSRLSGLAWVRLLYVHPKGIDRRFLEVFESEPRICAYLDIPIQHASDKVLAHMSRSYTRGDLEKLFGALADSGKAPSLRTSVMVGFPGETESDVDELVSFLGAVRFRQMAVFEYSPQAGTRAACLPNQVPDELRRERRHQLELILEEFAAENAQADVGRTTTALIESADGVGAALGRTEWQAPEVDGSIRISTRADRGSLVRVRIARSDGLDLEGEGLDAS